jgi:phosphate transport system protein
MDQKSSKKNNMTNLERELKDLKGMILKMMYLVENQLKKSKKAFSKQKVGLAKEIHQMENRVNSMELNINKECENIIALYNPVASDLRLVLAILKIAINLERIGDHADKIARYVRKEKITKPYDDKLLENIGLDKIFDTALLMVNEAIEGFHSENTEIARDVFEKDEIINGVFKNTIKVLRDYLKETPDSISSLFYMFSILNKLERVGDLAKNIAEETIFYIEAELVHH